MLCKIIIAALTVLTLFRSKQQHANSTAVSWPGSCLCPDPPAGTAGDSMLLLPSLLHASAVCIALPKTKNQPKSNLCISCQCINT
jgi:hypothetical protein